MQILQFVGIVVVLAMASTTAFQVAPRFVLNLSLPAAQRWNGVVNTVLKRHSWNHSFGPLFAHYNASLVSQLSAADRMILYGTLPSIPNLLDELTGIEAQFSAIGHPEIDFHFLVTWVWFHELDHASDLRGTKAFDTVHRQRAAARARAQGKKAPSPPPVDQIAACTGILALPQDPTLDTLHARNLDQTVYDARNLTLQIDVYANATADQAAGKPPLFQAIDFYWMTTGFVTAQMPQGVTLEENWRYQNNLTLSDILVLIGNGVVPQTRMFRNALESIAQAQLNPATTVDPFSYMITYLTTTPFASPFYAIVSGTKRRGAVVSVSIYGGDTNVEYLGANKNWYMVQTNYDRWLPDPAFDPRRTFAEYALGQLGQQDGATEMGLWQSISIYPVHNTQTYYTTIMSVAKNTTRGFIRVALVPDPKLYGDVNRSDFGPTW